MPNPTDIKEMNTYMYLWNESLADSTIEDVTNRSQIVLSVSLNFKYLIFGILKNYCQLAIFEIISEWKLINFFYENYSHNWKLLEETCPISNCNLTETCI